MLHRCSGKGRGSKGRSNKKLIDYWRWLTINNGENPKYCKSCQRDCSGCEEEYPERHRPDLLPENILCQEVYELIFEVRDGMSGVLNYDFMFKLMDKMKIDDEDQFDIFTKIKQVDMKLQKLQNTKSKSKPSRRDTYAR